MGISTGWGGISYSNIIDSTDNILNMKSFNIKV